MLFLNKNDIIYTKSIIHRPKPYSQIMIIELKQNKPSCSPAFDICRDLYFNGQTVAAYKEAIVRKKERVAQLPEDFLLCASIARSCGKRLQYRALRKLAYRRFPNHFETTFHYAQALAAQRYHLKALEILNHLKQKADESQRCLVISEEAYINAACDFQVTAQRHMDSLENDSAADHPFVWYNLACTANELTNWEQSVAYNRRAVDAAPLWVRARVNLIHALLACGREADAEKEFQVGFEQKIEDAFFDYFAALFDQTRNHLSEAVAKFERFLNRWPRSELFQSVAWVTSILLFETGNTDKAHVIAKEHLDETAQDFKSVSGKRSHAYLPTPAVIQKHNQCVPTVASAAAWIQGVKLDIPSLSSSMQCKQGTALWRMCKVMHKHGFMSYCLKAEDAILKYMLDRHVPLIGSTTGLFNSHVELICGYNENIDIYYLRDPATWFPFAISADVVKKRYFMRGNSVLALIHERMAENIKVPEEWISTEGSSLLELENACDNGHLDLAEKNYNHISNASSAAFSRDSCSYCVILSPRQHQQAMLTYATDEDQHILIRIRAMLTALSRSTLAEIKKMIENSKEMYSPFFSRYINMLITMTEGDWNQALILIDQLLNRNASLAYLWAYRSDLLSEIGQTEKARENLARALEMMPESTWLQEKALWRMTHRSASYQSKLDVLKKLSREYPDRHELKISLARHMRSGPDGIAYEMAEKKCQNFLPRDVASYERLADWFLMQERKDLARKILEEGRKFLKEDLPKLPFENEDDAEPKSGSPVNVPKNHVESLFDTAYKIYRETDADDLRECDAVNELIQLYDSGKLSWTDAMLLISLRTKWALSRKCHSDIIIGRLRKMLPPSIDGPVVPAVNYYLELVEDRVTTRDVAVCLIDWAEKNLKNQELSAQLMFNLAMLHQTAGHLKKSMDILQRIKTIDNAYVPAYFQIGQTYLRQENYTKAREALRQCLYISPGLFGAMESMIHLCEITGRHDEILAYRLNITQKFPYSEHYYFQWLAACAESQGFEHALVELKMSEDRFTLPTLRLMGARLLINFRKYQEAKELVEGDEEIREQNEYQYSIILILCATAMNDQKRLLDLVRQAIVKWPDDEWVQRQYIDALSSAKPAEARDYLITQLCGDHPNYELGYGYLNNSSNWLDDTITLIEKAPPDNKAVLAEIFGRLMNTSDHQKEYLAFLKWCNINLPEVVNLREQLAIMLDLMRRHDQAQKIAEDLYAKDPDNPRWLDLMARCCQDNTPKKALEYLEKEYKINQSADCLCKMARSYQIMGKRSKAIELYTDVLAKNQSDTLAMVNLFHLGVKPREIQSAIFWALSENLGAHDEYFHVAAVKVALAVKERMPSEWIVGARIRYQLVLSHGGFKDEHKLLKWAIIAWLSKWRQPEEAKKYGFLWDRLQANYFWPRQKWIPKIVPESKGMNLDSGTI